MSGCKNKFDCAVKLSAWWTKAVNLLQSPFLLVIRLYWGWQFFQTGWGKLQNISRVITYFQSLHILLPGANAWIVASMECFGGLLLMAGLASRIVALGLAFDMVISYLATDTEALKSLFSDSTKFVQDTAFPFLMITLTVLVFGAGAFSLDWLIARYLSKKVETPP